MERRYLLLVFFCFIAISAFSQRTITGVVKGADDGETLPQATIMEKGTRNGTVTDFDGNFKLEVSDTATHISVSFIGMRTKTVDITNKSTVEVFLESDVVDLEEVVISVPYSNQKKGSFTGAVGIIRSNKLEENQSESVDEILQGSVAGLVSANSSGQPGAASEIRIRGIGSINASSEPLYVIDGVPVSSSSQGFIKDEASEGSATGASYTSGPSVLSMINPADIESITVLKDAAASSLYGSRASNGVIMITTKQGKAGKTVFNFSTTHSFASRTHSNFEMMNADEYINWQKTAMQNAGYAERQITSEAESDEYDTDWFDEVFQNAFSQSYQLSASGGDIKTSFFTSGSYQKQEGTVINTDLEEINARLNLVHKPTDNLSLSLKFFPSYNKQNVTPFSADVANPVTGAYLLKPTDPIVVGEGYNFDNNLFNVVGISNLDENSSESFRFMGNASLQYDFHPLLKFKSIFSNDYYKQEELKYQNPLTPDGMLVDGRVVKSYIGRNDITSSNTLQFNDSLRDGNFTALIGYEIQKSVTERMQASAVGFPNADSYSFNAASRMESGDQLDSDWAIVSYLSNIQYNFKSRYYLSASFRRDGSSRFDKNRYGNFWSVGFSWRLSETKFVHNINALNSLKLRASYGTSGNSEVDDYAAYYIYGYGADYNGESGIAPVQMGNAGLTWEKNNNADLGLDFRLFRKLQGSIEGYYRRTWDLLLAVPVSATNGFDVQMQNVGAMRNYGLELSLSTPVMEKDNFLWNLSGNFMTNENEVISLYEGQDIVKGAKIVRVGETFNSFYLVEWAGVNPADGAALWYDENGNVTDKYEDADKKIVGSADPDFVASLTNEFEYKNIACSFSLYVKYGNQIYNNTAEAIMSDGAFKFNQSKDALHYWTKPGDVTEVPKPVYNNTSNSNETSTRFLEDGSYLRLKDISVSYTLPRKVLSKFKISSLKVFVKGSNLYTLTHYSGIDPEQNVRGVDFFSYPSAQTVSVGASMKF